MEPRLAGDRNPKAAKKTLKKQQTKQPFTSK